MFGTRNHFTEILFQEEELVALTTLSAYSIIFQEWCELVLPLALGDFEKVKELGVMAERPLRDSLRAVDRRLLFATLRDLPLRWIAKVTGSDESSDTMQLVREATKCVLSYAACDFHKPSETPQGSTAVFLSAGEAQVLLGQLPFIMGGLLGGSIARMESLKASRIVAVGARLDPQIPPFPSSEEMLRKRLIVQEAPRIRLRSNDELVADVRSIYRRRELHGSSSLAGLQVNLETGAEVKAQNWWSLGIPTLHGHWPSLHDLWLPKQNVGLLQTSYVIEPVGLASTTREMQLFESRFSQSLNITFHELEWFTEGVFRLVAIQSGVYAIYESLEIANHHARDNVQTDRLLDDPETFLKGAHDVWNRGAIRNSRIWFVETLHGVLDGEYPREAIERLVTAFTAEGDLRNWFKPFVFYEMTNEMLVLDLFEFVDFHERVLQAVSATILGQGDIRGSLFEVRCTDRILDEIGLSITDPRVIRSFPMKFKERNYGDVDLAIVTGETLINIDMKSRQKDFNYFYGGPEFVEKRQESLVRSLDDKVTARGEKLASLLNDSFQSKSRALLPAKITKTFSFLCIAGPEFLTHSKPSLWYGDIPRASTPSELASLILDLSRLHEAGPVNL